jgi:hypothetical protein
LSFGKTPSVTDSASLEKSNFFDFEIVVGVVVAGKKKGWYRCDGKE